MPYGTFVNNFPPAFFMIVHLAAFLIGAFFARRALSEGVTAAGWGFALYSIAEIVYMTYHLDWTIFLFAHTIAEILDLAAFVLVFISVVQHVGLGVSRKATQA